MRRTVTILTMTTIAMLTLSAIAYAAAPIPVLVDPEGKLSNPTAGLSLAAGDLFGSGVCVVGDIDSDGVDDLAVGAEGTDGSGLSASGAVWILLMNADETIKTATKVDASSAVMGGLLSVDDEFGTSVAAIGDVDGNGAPDVAVGAPNEDDWDIDGDNVDDGAGINRGAVYILFLNTDGTVRKAQKLSDIDPVIAIPNNSDQFGDAVTSLGDLDGAGGSQLALAVGAPGDRVDGFLKGAVWIVFMSYVGGGTDAMVVASTQKISDSVGTPASFSLTNSVTFGTSLSTLPDMNADSRRELVVGSNLDDDNDPNVVSLAINRGAVWIMRMNADGTVSVADKISDTAGGFTGVLEDSDFFGDSVQGLDDIDGDGNPDLAVGAGGDDDGGDGRGAVYLLYLNANSTVKTHRKISDTDGDFDATLDNSDMFGNSLGVSDLDNDNTPELLMGAQGDDDGAGSAGAVHIGHLAIAVDAPKSDALVVDNGTPGIADPGDVIEYTISATNLGFVAADNASFSDAIPAQTTYVGGSVTTDRGTASFDGTSINVTGIGTLTPQTTNPGADNTVNVTFQVTIDSPLLVVPSAISNQGALDSDNFASPILTDDPDTPADNDPTLTPLIQPPVAICQNIAVIGDSTVACVVNDVDPALVDNGSFDPQGFSFTLTLLPPPAYTLGINPVKLIVTSSSGLADTCDATITVECPVPVRLSAFSVARHGSDAQIAWEVAEASNHLGFDVYREVNGSDRVQINDHLLSGKQSYVFFDENAPRGEVDYWLAEIGRNGNVSWHGPVTLSSAPAIAPVLVMGPAQPNPFNASTRIAYTVPESRHVKLAVYDILGRQVAVLVNEVQGPGEFTASWDGRTNAGEQAVVGLYILRLQAGKESHVQKTVLTR